MNQTNIDKLFQAIAPPADRQPSATRTSIDTLRFVEHLSQASSTVFEIVRSTSGFDSSSIHSSADCNLPPTNSNLSSRQPSNSSDESKTPVDLPAPPERKPTDEAGPSADEIADGDEANDSLDDETTTLAGAAQSTDVTPPDKSQPKSRHVDHDGRVRAKADIAAQEKTKPQAEVGTQVDGAPARSEAVTNAVDVTLPVVEGDNIALAGNKEFVAQEIEQDDNSAASAEKGERSSAANKNSGEYDSTNGANPTTHLASTAKTVGVDTLNGEQAVPQGDDDAVPNMKAPIKKGDTERSSDNDSSREGTTPPRGNLQNDAVASAAKAAATAIANGVVANIANTTDKDIAKDSSDKSAKPVGVKTDNVVGALSRAARAAGDITRGAQEANANDVPRIDPSRFVGRVTKAFQTANERGGALQLRLSPPELGALRIQLTVKDGVMSAALETDNANARRLLLDHLPALRDRLAEQNIRVERFDVDVRQENNGGQANPHGSNQHSYQQQPDRPEPRIARPQQAASETVLPDLPAVTTQISSTGINLFV